MTFVPSWLDKAFLASKSVKLNGSGLPNRPTINFVGGPTSVQDDPGNDATTVQISGAQLTSTTAPYTQPAYLSSVTVTVQDSGSFIVGQGVVSANLSGTIGNYQVSAKPTSTSITLLNLGYYDSVDAGTVVATGAVIYASGSGRVRYYPMPSTAEYAYDFQGAANVTSLANQGNAGASGNLTCGATNYVRVRTPIGYGWLHAKGSITGRLQATTPITFSGWTSWTIEACIRMVSNTASKIFIMAVGSNQIYVTAGILGASHSGGASFAASSNYTQWLFPDLVHVAAVWDGSTIRMYLDGNPVPTGAGTGTFTVAQTGTASASSGILEINGLSTINSDGLIVCRAAAHKNWAAPQSYCEAVARAAKNWA